MSTLQHNVLNEATHLLVVPGPDHYEAIFTRENLVRDDGRMGSTMPCGFFPCDEVVGCDIG